MKYAYFLGCITPNRYAGIEASTRKVFKEFDIECVEVPGASCCPAPGVFGSFDLKTWLTIAARNLAIAEEQECDMTLTCNGCYGTLQEANHLLQENPHLVEMVNEILAEEGHQYKGTIQVKHCVEILHNVVGLDTIKEHIKKPLDGIKVAVHYGCHFLKPSEVRRQGSSERPRLVDELVDATGAESVDYKDKIVCCGAGGGVRTRDLEKSLLFTLDKVNNANAVGADCILDICAFCHLQMDVGQTELKDKFGKEFKNIPILFYTQLLGLAMGFTPDELGINMHQIPMSDKILQI